MGFIEDLKRKRAAEEEMQREKEKKRFYQDHAWLKEEETPRYDDKQYRTSVMHADKSNFPNLIRELRSVIPIKNEKEYFEDKKIRKWDEIHVFIEGNDAGQVTGAEFTLGWDYQWDNQWNRQCYVHKRINVKFYPNGKIKVDGGWFGKTELLFDEWKDNLEIQEKALEKAFKHPGKGYFVPPTVEMGGYGL